MFRLLCLLMGLSGLLFAGVASAAEVTPALGINLSGPADWNTEMPFRDPWRLSRTWISQRKGAGWGKGPKLVTDDRGWVTHLERECWAESPIMTHCNGMVPTGVWTVLYSGKGHLGFSHGKVLSDENGRLELKLARSDPLFVRLHATDPADYLRDIRMIPPRLSAEQLDANPWNPNLLARWQGMASLRFMDFMHTNGSTVQRWEQRPKMADATWTHGIPLEMMCDLANRLHADPWFCMPHLADDDYVRRFAQQAKELIDPDLKIYVEYSNEVWNGQFSQNRYAAKKGQELGFAEKPWEAAWKYTGYRSSQVFTIWEEVFGGTDRLVRVLASQGANPYVSDRICEFQDAYKQADALAIAPYISFNVPAAEADAVAALGVEGVLERLADEKLPQCIEWMHQQKKSADKWGLKMIAYEGGQHMVGVRGGENNKKLEEVFKAANKHRRMGEIYRDYYQAWEQAGGDLFAAFSSVGGWSKWGSWGLMQRDDDNPRDYPKFIASLKWAEACGQNVNLPRE